MPTKKFHGLTSLPEFIAWATRQREAWEAINRSKNRLIYKLPEATPPDGKENV